MAEAGAKAAVAALKDATLIKSKKADWRLVAAAQAMLRGEHPDEFAAASAMGKPIKQRSQVSNWLDKLRELERMRASLRSQPGSSGSAAGSSLLVQPGWIHEHAPGVKQLSVSAPVVSPGKQHEMRSLSAVVTTPLGTKRPASATVAYTLPPEGEPASAAKRRDDRHRRREERAIRSMDFSEAVQAHAEAEAERKSSARNEGNQLLVQLPVDVPPYGLSAELLLSAAWITRQLPLIEPGSLVVGELKLVDERALRVRELQMPCGVCGWANTHGNMGCRSKCRPMSAEERRPLEDGIRRIDEGKDPAFTAFRNINVTVDDAHFRPFCSSNTFPYSNIDRFCGAPLQLMTIASDAFGVGPSTEAVMAAWLSSVVGHKAVTVYFL